MYSTQEVSRPEITAFLEQAHKADDYFLAQKIFPVRSVKARAGRYPRLDIAEGKLMRRDTTDRNSTGTYNEITRQHGWDTYDCSDRGLEERIDDTKVSEMSSFFSLEKLTGKLVRRAVALDFEVTAAGLLMNESNFGTQTAKVNYTEANIDTVDAPYDIEAACEAIISRGEVANTMVLSLKLWNFLKRSKQMQAYVWGKLTDSSGRKQLTKENLADVFDLKNILIAKGHHDTGKGKTASISSVWGTSHLWVGNVQGGDFDEGGVGRTLTWEADCPNGLFATETYRDPKRRSDMLRVRSNSAEKLVNTNAGELVKTNFA